MADEETGLVTQLNVPIPFFDDDVNEAFEQFFITQLVIVNATNRDLVTTDRRTCQCAILDNDRKSLPCNKIEWTP